MDTRTKDFIGDLIRRILALPKKDEGKVIMNILDAKVVIPKAHVDNTFIATNSNVFKENIAPTSHHTCVFRISIETNSSIDLVLFSVFAYGDFKTAEISILKKFAAKETYIIDTFVLPNETVNMKFDRDMDIIKMSVSELYVTHGV